VNPTTVVHLKIKGTHGSTDTARAGRIGIRQHKSLIGIVPFTIVFSLIAFITVFAFITVMAVMHLHKIVPLGPFNNAPKE
jgi:hypothetical protein